MGRKLSARITAGTNGTRTVRPLEPRPCALRISRDDGTPRVMTLTVMFTDISRSTAIRLALGEDRADEWFVRIDTLTRATVAAHGGRVVKTLGDGAIAVFSSASAALTAATALQRRFSTHRVLAGTPAPLLRIGMTSGDVLVSRDDVAGMPVTRAARLCASARPGSILASSMVVQLSNGRGGHVSRLLGPLALPGVDRPVDAHDVQWSQPAGVRIDLGAPPRDARRSGSGADHRTRRPAHDRPALTSVRACATPAASIR
jgi:class 3 adenylate cyclase